MIISNSQIMSLQSCEMKFYFEHNDSLRPIEYPDAMERGIFGHHLFEAAFKKMQDGGTYEECIEAMNPVVLEKAHDAELLKAYRLVCAFVAWVFNQPWKIIAVEMNFMHPVGDDLFAYTPDLIIEWTSGPRRGNRAILDFKFTGQYWSDNEINVFQQLPKYMLYYNKGRKENKVTQCAVVMLNTRAANGARGEQLFLLKWLPINKKKLQRIEYENEVMMRRVRLIKDTHKSSDDYMRTVNTFVCKMCFFAKPCAMLLAGQDPSRVLRELFVHNTYFEDNYGPDDKAVS